ncbi:MULTISPECIES: siderophore-interacting protein [unclassified Psychrobacter]|uniref:siderophore-interacting protein n=1 Tax=Psychrobacter TaxID=497 RepID=UPI0018678584|nr:MULTISPECIES: SIP domain-containing protein [unclassified Psychrobacter]MBE8610721.1 SIP domain-containing protein [Pseudomonas lundensis]WLG12630.1 SIP domain-containing protein [Psychrobacter cibarius]
MSQVFDQHHTDKMPLPMVAKIKFMNHVNDEHQDELALFVEAFADTKLSNDMAVVVAEVYSNGLLLEASVQNVEALPNHKVEMLSDGISQFFIEFENVIDETITLKSQYINLLQVASKKLGKLAIKQQERYFTVIDGYYASPNMFRLVVAAPADTPLNYAGYAYLFEMNTDVSISHNSAAASEKLQRYYTLRKAWQDAETQQIQGWVDIYIHGDTSGGNWARAVQAGTQLKSVRDYPERIAHLNDGQCLLLCDETSMPTVANLLENWQNPIAPIVIVMTNDGAELSYLQEIELSQTLAEINSFKQDNIVHILNTPSIDLPDAIVSAIDTRLEDGSILIEKVWGALSAADAKILRRQLKTKFDLSRQDMVMKVYWRTS